MFRFRLTAGEMAFIFYLNKKKVLRMRKAILIHILFCLTLLLFVFHCEKPGKRIFYVNSYHEGYAPSDTILLAIQKKIATRSDLILKVFFLDAYHHPQEEFLLKKAKEAVEAIKAFDPHVLIVSDDPAVKYVVAPYFTKGPMPVVFCGVNWTCKQYGLPTGWVTGILEVLPIEPLMLTIQPYYPGIRQVFILSGNTPSERKNARMVESVFREMGYIPEIETVNAFNLWKQFFEAANTSADAIFLLSNEGVSGWNDTEAYEFVFRNIQKPVLTCEESLMRYAVLGVTKVEREQGEWAVQTALEILGGKNPMNIPVIPGRGVRYFLNPVLADKIEFKPDDVLLKKVQEVH